MSLHLLHFPAISKDQLCHTHSSFLDTVSMCLLNTRKLRITQKLVLNLAIAT